MQRGISENIETIYLDKCMVTKLKYIQIWWHRDFIEKLDQCCYLLVQTIMVTKTEYVLCGKLIEINLFPFDSQKNVK
jgi:hypothetical protein